MRFRPNPVKWQVEQFAGNFNPAGHQPKSIEFRRRIWTILYGI